MGARPLHAICISPEEVPLCAISPPVVLVASLFAATADQAYAETLLIERVGAEAGMTLPARGMRMADVERKFGAPAQRLEPRGGESRSCPTINRWTYPNFVVYFEKDRVIDAVAIRADAERSRPQGPDPLTWQTRIVFRRNGNPSPPS